ncbi:MAG: VWA domain-containing protein, partial [Bacteroidales bacterium]
MVTVSVTDGDRFVTGLRKEHFKVYEDGVLMKTDFFDPSQSTLEVAIGVDISESMRESIGDVKENVKRFLAKLRPEDRATVGAFNEEYYVAAAPDLERSVQMKKVGQLASWGMTSLYDVILRSFDQLGGKPGRHALVIFTDGDDTASRASRQAVEKRVARNDAGLFIIGQGNAQKQGDLRALCDRLATKSGGMAFFPTDATSLARAFDRIADELAHQYLLTYEPRSVKADGRERRLKVEVAGGYQVRHAEGYTPK